MSKKILYTLLSISLLAFISFTTTFAAETISADEITPYDSIVVVSLNTETFSTVFVGNYPILLPDFVKVTNHIANIGDIEVRFVNQNGSLLADAKVISPGDTKTFIVPPDLLGLGNGYYYIQARAVDEAGGYSIGVNLADEGADIQTLQLSASTWSTAFVLNVPADEPTKVEIVNHTASPGSIIVRLTYEDGTLVESAKTIAPGETADFTIPVVAELAGDIVLVQMMAAEEAGTFFFTITQSK